MTLKRKSGGSMVDVSSVKRRSGGAWVNVSNVYKRVSGAWVKVWPTDPPITIGNKPASNIIYSTGSVGGVSRTKSAAPALTVSGGNGSYTYAWAWLSGDVIDVSATNVLNPTFSKFLAPDGGTLSTYRLTVTSGAQSTTYDMSIQLSN